MDRTSSNAGANPSTPCPYKYWTDLHRSRGWPWILLLNEDCQSALPCHFEGVVGQAENSLLCKHIARQPQCVYWSRWLNTSGYCISQLPTAVLTSTVIAFKAGIRGNRSTLSLDTPTFFLQRRKSFKFENTWLTKSLHRITHRLRIFNMNNERAWPPSKCRFRVGSCPMKVKRDTVEW